MNEQIKDRFIQYMYSFPHKKAYHAIQEDIRDHISVLTDRTEGHRNELYIHIPFCTSRCGYCNLFSCAGEAGRLADAYLDAVERQAEQYAGLLPAGTEFDGLTVGGGTPLVLSEEQLKRLFLIAKDYFGVYGGAGKGIVVETSPNETCPDKLDVLKDAGVSRLSIGVQSFSEKELRILHRNHGTAQIRYALEQIRKQRFACVNLDLIYGIPGQTAESLITSCRQAIAYQPEELFVYPLYIRPETYNAAAYSVMQKKESAALRESLQRTVWDFLQQEGYAPVSMRCFREQKSQRMEEHEGTCGFGSTLSIGCGGRSYLGKLHFCTPYAVGQEACVRILEDYIREPDYTEIRHGYILSEREQRIRFCLKQLLHIQGVDRKTYCLHFGNSVEEDFPLLEEWQKDGWVCADPERVWLSEEGLLLSDYLGPKLAMCDARIF